MFRSGKNRLVAIASMMVMLIGVLLGTEVVRAQGLDRNNLADGRYEVPVALWHATNEALSSANSHLVSAIVEVNGDYASLFLHMGSELIVAMRYQDAEDNWVDMVGPVANEQQDLWSFTMPIGINVEMARVGFTIETPMGAMDQEARLRLDWDELELIELAEDLGSEVELPNPDSEIPTTPESPNPPVNPEGEQSGGGHPGAPQPPVNPNPVPPLSEWGVGESELDPENLEDGTYAVSLALWHATNDTPSMAAAVLQDGADIVVEDGVSRMIIHTYITEIMGMPARLEGLRVFDGGAEMEVIRVEIESLAFNLSGDSFSFVLPSTEEFIDIEVTTMNGAMVQNARLRVDWSTLEQT